MKKPAPQSGAPSPGTVQPAMQHRLQPSAKNLEKDAPVQLVGIEASADVDVRMAPSLSLADLRRQWEAAQLVPTMANTLPEAGHLLGSDPAATCSPPGYMSLQEPSVPLEPSPETIAEIWRGAAWGLQELEAAHGQGGVSELKLLAKGKAMPMQLGHDQEGAPDPSANPAEPNYERASSEDDITMPTSMLFLQSQRSLGREERAPPRSPPAEPACNVLAVCHPTVSAFPAVESTGVNRTVSAALTGSASCARPSVSATEVMAELLRRSRDSGATQCSATTATALDAILASGSNIGGTRSPHTGAVQQLRSISEVLFFAGMNDLVRLQQVLAQGQLDVKAVCDYDGRTPLHLAAAEGAWQATEWLLQHGVAVNAVDRFGRTPLMDALLAKHTALAQALIEAGGMVVEDGMLRSAANSIAFGGLSSILSSQCSQLHISSWEIIPNDLTLGPSIGEGQFGVVYRGLWHRMPVAVKALKSGSEVHLKEFASEIATLLRIHHPNIVQFLGASTRSEPYLLVTEVMEGGSLDDAFAARVRFPLRRAVEVALDIARGVHYLHKGNPHAIVHRDLKPSNVLFAGTSHGTTSRELALGCQLHVDIGVAKVADFGLSKTLNASARPNTLPSGTLDHYGAFTESPSPAVAPLESGSRAPRSSSASPARLSQGVLTDGYLSAPVPMTGGTGAYLYMAGEVFRHEPYNSKADVYSFSMIMYELVTGQCPFRGLEPISAAMRAAVDNVRPTFPLDTPPHHLPEDHPLLLRVHRLITRCWESAPMKRPTFEQIILDLESILASFKTPRLRYADMVQLQPRKQHKEHRASGAGNSSSRGLQKTAVRNSAAPPPWQRSGSPNEEAAFNLISFPPRHLKPLKTVVGGPTPRAPMLANPTLDIAAASQTRIDPAVVEREGPKPKLGVLKRLREKLQSVSFGCCTEPSAMYMSDIDCDSRHSDGMRSVGSSLFSRLRRR